MKILNPFQKKQSLGKKVSQKLHLPHKASKKEKILEFILNTLLYLSIFLAGYVVAKLQSLFSLAN